MEQERTDLLKEIFSTFTGMQRLMHSQFQRAFEELKIAPSQLQLLFIIEDAQPISLKDLAARTYLTPGAITQLIDILVENNYISRTPHEKDRRITCVSMTALGAEKITALKARKQEMYEQVVSNLNNEELRVYLKVQQKMIQHLEEDFCERQKHSSKE